MTTVNISVTVDFQCNECGKLNNFHGNSECLEEYSWWGGDQTGILIQVPCLYCHKLNEFHLDGTAVQYI